LRGTLCRHSFSQLLMLCHTQCLTTTHFTALLVCIVYSVRDKLCSVSCKHHQQQFLLDLQAIASILASITISSTTTTTINSSSSSSHKHSLLYCTMYCFLRLEVPVVQSTIQASLSILAMMGVGLC